MVIDVFGHVISILARLYTTSYFKCICC